MKLGTTVEDNQWSRVVNTRAPARTIHLHHQTCVYTVVYSRRLCEMRVCNSKKRTVVGKSDEVLRRAAFGSGGGGRGGEVGGNVRIYQSSIFMKVP